MSVNTAMMAMGVAEFALWVALGFLFWKKTLYRRFPAMSVYLALHIAAVPVLLATLYAMQAHIQDHRYDAIYTYSYVSVYIASAVLLFFICTEIFRSALSGFPGLSKIGIVLFRWAALISVIVSLTSISMKQMRHWGFASAYAHGGVNLVASISFALMHSVSVLELCLLAFLCLGMNALRLSIRDMGFGIALGFGLMTTNELVVSSLISHTTSMTAPLQFVYESLILVSLAIWIVYSVMPEPVRKPVVMPVTSRIYRWNEIASALGHTGTQVAVQQPANSFFLTDVEKVVEKVLKRNLKGRESES